MDSDVFVKLIVNKGFNNIDMSMVPDNKEIYDRAAKVLFEQNRVVEAVKCWLVAGTPMPKEELMKVANNEFSIGNKEVALFIFKAVDSEMATFIEKNYSNNL